jgi:small subunit ribosomal protein S16
VNIKEERALYWLNVGAQPTDTVKSLLRDKGIILKRELKRKGLSEEKIEAEFQEWFKLREERIKSRASSRKSKKSKEKKSKEESIEEGTAEVKGAASEENTAKEE